MGLSIGLVGCGWIAAGFHGPALAAYAARHQETRLLACCDTDAARARAFGQRFGFERWYTSIAEMLTESRPDAVCLAVPDQATCALTCQLVEAGVPVLLEKPPGRTVAEIDRMIAAARSTGVRVEVAFNRRSMPLIGRAKALLADFSPGEIFHIDYQMTRVNRRDPDFSLTAIHGIDLISYLGGDYDEISIRYQPVESVGAGVCNIYVHGALKSGPLVDLRFLPVTGAVTERLAIHGKDRTLYVDLPVAGGLDGAGRLVYVREREVQPDDNAADGTEPWEVGGFYEEDRRFFEHVRQEKGGAEELVAARQAVAVMEAVRGRQSGFRG